MTGPDRWRIPGVWCLLAVCLAAVSVAPAADRGLKRGAREVMGAAAEIPTYHALVIGINDYEHWQDLRQAYDDARLVAGLLKSKYGFDDVRTLYNRDATLTAIMRQLRDLTRTLTPRDSLLIYFAGHGYYDRLLKKGYWVPSEAREKIGQEPAMSDWLHNTNLKEYLDAMQARHVLVVSDSCFSGAMFRGGRVDLQDKAQTWYQRAISQPTRWCVASGDLETVPDQSVFAKKLLQALQYPRQSVFAASDLAGWIKNDVAAHTGRRPMFGPMSTMSGSDLGEFVFLVHEEATPTPVAMSTPEPMPEPMPEPTPVAEPVRTGTLVVETPLDADVQLDGGKPFRVKAGKGLRWEALPIGAHVVTVTPRDSSQGITQPWKETAQVASDRTVTLDAFEDELRQLNVARQRELERAREAALEAERQAALEEQRRRYEAALEAERQRRLEAEREAESNEKKRRRPRAH